MKFKFVYIVVLFFIGTIACFSQNTERRPFKDALIFDLKGNVKNCKIKSESGSVSEVSFKEDGSLISKYIIEIQRDESGFPKCLIEKSLIETGADLLNSNPLLALVLGFNLGDLGDMVAAKDTVEYVFIDDNLFMEKHDRYYNIYKNTVKGYVCEKTSRTYYNNLEELETVIDDFYSDREYRLGKYWVEVDYLYEVINIDVRGNWIKRKVINPDGTEEYETREIVYWENLADEIVSEEVHRLLSLQRFAEAKKLCEKTIELNRNNGQIYILLAEVYMANPKWCDDDVLNKCVYLLAIDVLTEAKDKDTKESVNKIANKMIAECMTKTPTDADLFLNGLQKGDDLKIGGWINETLTIK